MSEVQEVYLSLQIEEEDSGRHSEEDRGGAEGEEIKKPNRQMAIIQSRRSIRDVFGGFMCYYCKRKRNGSVQVPPHVEPTIEMKFNNAVALGCLDIKLSTLVCSGP